VSVRPLVSAVFEYRLMGRAMLLAGAVMVGVGALIESARDALVGLLVPLAVVTPGMYLLIYRRFLRAAAENPPPAPTDARERRTVTVRRVAASTAPPIIVAGTFAALTGLPSPFGALLIGNALAMLTATRSLAAWERANGPLLREPRVRFNRPGSRGWARGRGRMDPQDFYRDTPSRPPPT
jgi:hypothetical protein